PNNTNANLRYNNMGKNDSKNWSVEPQISYDKIIGKGHLNVLLGTTFQQSNLDYLQIYATGFASDALISNPANAASSSISIFSNTLYHYQAVYGRIGYSWED